MSDQAEPVLALGLMSGTSADGVDAAVIRTNGESIIEFLGATTVQYATQLRQDLITAAQHDVPLEQVLFLEKQLTDAHVGVSLALLAQLNLEPSQLHVVGFHGHTLRHDARLGITWQLGDAALLAANVAVPGSTTRVVHDFRRADIAFGGEGAPLAPLFHRELVANQMLPAMVLNLGGVANVTWIGSNGEIRAGDTGPGCGLLDAWTAQHLNEPFDRDGKLAAAGKADLRIVESAIQHVFFQRPLPKSADRYEFNFVDVSELSLADGAATLCELTAAGVAVVVDGVAERPVTTWVTGGGARNPTLLQALRTRLGEVRSIEAIGQRADSLEAECFAWLAVRRLRGLPTSLPETTGCERPTCGGAVTCIQS